MKLPGHRPGRAPGVPLLVALILLLLVTASVEGRSLGRWQIVRPAPDGAGWCPSLEAPPQGFSPLVFEADGPVATLIFLARNELDGVWLNHRLDNVAVVEEMAFELTRDELACTSVIDGSNFCCNESEDGSFANLFFSEGGVDPSRVVFSDDFDLGPDPRWWGVVNAGAGPVFWIDGESAPQPPEERPAGGALWMGREEDGDVVLEARLNLTGLESGKSYAITGWWHVLDHQGVEGLLEVRAETPPPLLSPGLPQQLNNLTEGDQVLPSVGGSPGGEAVVVWQTPDLGGLCDSVHGRRFTAEGLEGPEMFLREVSSCTDGGEARRPSVGASRLDDVFALTWVETGFQPRIMARRFSMSDGAPLGPPLLVRDTAQSGGLELTATNVEWDSGEDRFLISWEEGSLLPSGTVLEHWGRVYDRSGSPQSDVSLLAGARGRVAWSLGNLVSAWIDGEPDQGFPFEAYTRLWASDGRPLSEIFKLTDTGEVAELALASDASGGLVLFWQDFDSSGNPVLSVSPFRFGIDPSRRAATLAGAAADRLQPRTLPAVTSQVELATDGEEFLALWIGRDRPRRVLGQLIESPALPVDGSFEVAPLSLASQTEPALSSAGMGRYVISWEEARDGSPGGKEIFARSLARVRPLVAGESERGLAGGAERSMRFFRVAVPPGTGYLTVRTGGGTGNADLYLRRGLLPSRSLFDLAQRDEGNRALLRVTSPLDDLWYVGLAASPSYEDVTLEVSYAGPPPRPAAAFGFHPAEPEAGERVLFTDLSTGEPEVWRWDFGDGSSSDRRNPTHVFSSPGSHEVTLTVSNESGSDVATRTVVVAEPPPERTCIAGEEDLCLNQTRFRVEVSWRDFQGVEGSGRVVPFGSDDSGLFWFFREENWEMLVKVLDGCDVNRRFWVFSAATTDVEYTLRVTDTLAGTEKSYYNPPGRAAPAITDVEAFATCEAGTGPGDVQIPSPGSPPLGAERGTSGSDGCQSDAETLCLAGGRFRVELEWQDFSQQSGVGRVVPFGSDDSGLLWFFEEDNWEMLVKVLDGCRVNDRFWVFAAAGTDVGYTLRVTDTETGTVREYTNPLGTAAATLTDTSAFATCP